MPEHMEIKRTGLTDLSGGGFFIRRVASPGALAGRRAGKPLSRRFTPSPSSNKENVRPVWAVKTTPQRRRTPLPDWYPRTPLRDITAIVKAIERSRLRIAAARQQGETPEQFPQPVESTTTLPAEHTQAQDSLAIASGSGSTQSDARPAASRENSFKVYSLPSKSSLKTPTKPIDPAVADHMEKKLSSSIEQIEKMVKKKLKRTPEAAQPSKRASQRRTLMSMR
uniref:Uncharacterized protein n=1 Tax=Avena sativa TaxID=4498 RepID=A0ACD5UC05_AVESA